jgi:hypothetical protein
MDFAFRKRAGAAHWATLPAARMTHQTLRCLALRKKRGLPKKRRHQLSGYNEGGKKRRAIKWTSDRSNVFIFKLFEHRGAISTVTCTEAFIVSSGTLLGV